ncbi:hypothetical protein EDD15DRAFT_2199283 [Pisolithus albus]|nr:hypothetical protein EDD15DRAFT_2199283 [Pisolithus albus]
MGRSQDSTGGNETRNKEGAMQELITSVVETAVKPVSSGLENLQKSLNTVVAHAESNTVAAHADMLQGHVDPLHAALGTLQSEILSSINQHATSLNSNIDSLRNQTITTSQHVDELGRSVHAARNVMDETSEQVRDVANAQRITNSRLTDAVISSCQIYNADRGSGLVQQFKIIPFVSGDGTVQCPTSCGLPPLLDIRAINNLGDNRLDQYLDGYGINHVGLDRELKLSKLGEYIGYKPADSSTSHKMTFYVMLAMGCRLSGGFVILTPDSPHQNHTLTHWFLKRLPVSFQGGCRVPWQTYEGVATSDISGSYPVSVWWTPESLLIFDLPKILTISPFRCHRPAGFLHTHTMSNQWASQLEQYLERCGIGVPNSGGILAPPRLTFVWSTGGLSFIMRLRSPIYAVSLVLKCREPTRSGQSRSEDSRVQPPKHNRRPIDHGDLACERWRAEDDADSPALVI